VGEPKNDPIMHRLRGKLRRRRRVIHDERNTQRKVRKARRAIAFLEHLIANAQARRHGLDKEAVLDGCPLPLGHKLMLLDARRNGWEGVVTSADRRSVIERLLHKLGKSTQAELYQGFEEGRPGFLPANPRDRGTHMRIGDGVVGRLFEKLKWWQEGIDSTAATQLRLVLNSLGYKAYRPYDSASEEHHTNLKASPHDRLIERGLV
jgi:hypothetical protein